ncbi:MAG: hypothetical protein GPJ54_12185 [Candidatus Heimdallarchaeota archaeon]|nr:hypothetical protein [Candidatus Heimdallarchaeota archaeon]
MRSFLLFAVLFSMIIFPSNTSLATENDVPVISDDGKYHLQIIMSQWQFYVYQLQENESIEIAFREGNYMAKSGSDESVGPFVVSTGIVFEIYSVDVQHGLAIDDLGIALAADRPMPGETLGGKRSAATILPSEPTVLESHCHIFCGLGHPDENMDFVVGTPIDAESENLQISVLLLPLILSLSTVIYLNKRIR